MSTVLLISTMCSQRMKKILNKINSLELSGYKVKKDNLVARTSIAFFHLITKAPGGGSQWGGVPLTVDG